MPINLETGTVAGPIDSESTPVQSISQIKIFSPKFFSSTLTGNGQKRGLLNETVNPAMFPMNIPMTIEHTHAKKNKMTSGLTTTTSIPFNPLPYSAWTKMQKITRPANPLLTEIGTDKATCTKKIYLEMRPHSAVLEETEPSVQGGSKSKRFVPCYQVFVYVVANANEQVHTTVPRYRNLDTKSLENQVAHFFTTDPVTDLESMARDMVTMRWVIDFNELNTFAQSYNLYDNIVRRSEEWQTTLDISLEEFFRNITDGKQTQLKPKDLALTIKVIRHIDQYSAPLDLYRSIYQKIQVYFHPDDTKLICRQNLNLLLSDTMENLNKNKPNLNAVRTPNPVPPKSKTKFAYSTEQSRAIASQEPLVLVQSGAGTGKAQPYSAKLITPTGHTTMGEVKIGDKIIGRDGKAHIIKRIHEQGEKPGYHITFEDGSETEANPEHLWSILIDNELKTVTTQEWLDNEKYRTEGYLPMSEPVEYAFGEKMLPLDPYLLGSLIANGYLSGNRIVYISNNPDVNRAVKEAAERSNFTMRHTDNASINRFEFNHNADSDEHSIIQNRIVKLGLDVSPNARFIPDVYKTASIKQRKALLNGLFDNIGVIPQNRTYAKIKTESKQLAEDVLQVLWSLGLAAHTRRIGRTLWTVSLLDNRWNPFYKHIHAGSQTGPKHPLRRRIQSADTIKPVPMRCIEIDTPDKLYLTDDFIVTHNSTVILGRIDWMVANGVNPKDIMVLSFTNAAADHIKDLNPNVKSMTIAHMIHTIYTSNFPDHLLSELDTLCNSLDIYFPTDDTAMKFKTRCLAVRNKEPNAYVDLNNFIETYYAEVLNFLNTTRQTSLEIEIIICYQKIDTMVEPPEIQSQHLIIDEVQDNSVFEFVYALKYVEKHQESLFIVGDCSQTLYEFRASNPRAMNVLEASGVFATHQLQVNYRSNQEILDFANVILQNIEANQYAQIQLIANSMATVTEQSFRDHVNLKYERVSKLAEIHDIIQPLLASPELRAYMDACLARGEKIAFLAYTKNHVRAMEDAIHLIYPGAATSNLIPVIKDPTTVLSRFIQTCWSNIQFVPTKHILQIIVTEMQANLPKLSRTKNLNTQSTSYQKFAALASRTIDDWRRECARDVNDWEIQYQAGQITQDELLNRIKESMLDHEIKNNKTLQSLKSGQNKKIKEMNAKSNASFIFSTIHSAKGLEFDNVILIYKDNSDMSEADKRMYYVAMTRAMHTEFILAFNTSKRTRIQNDYEAIVAQLHQTHPMAAPAASQTAQAALPPQPPLITPGTPKTPTAGPQTPMAVPVVPPTAVTSPAQPPTQPPVIAPYHPAPAMISPMPMQTQPDGFDIPENPERPDIQDAPAAPDNANTGVNKFVSLKDLFPGAAPGKEMQVPADYKLDDIQLPSGYTFTNTNGQTCKLTGEQPEIPGEQE